MKRVGLVLKHSSPEAPAIARELIPWLAERQAEAVVPDEHDGLAPGVRVVPAGELRQHIDLLIVLGGDGTLLHAASLLAESDVPILGINLGRLGFLVPFDPGEAKDAIAGALEDKLEIEERMRLRVVLHRTGGEAIEKLALNDVVISQSAMARLIELQATLDGKRITVYKADGLIVCTSTGSTAYNLAAGGPIVAPGQSPMVITPICPHTLTNRPLIVPSRSTLEISLAAESHSVMLTVDGQWAHPLLPGDRVAITRSKAQLKLYRSERTYFEILRQKLKWGVREA